MIFAGRGIGAEGQEFAVSGFHFGGGGGEGAQGFGLRVGCHFEDRDGGAEAEGGRGFGIVENVADGFGGEGSEQESLLMPGQGLFPSGELQFAGEGGDAAAPVADGVAGDAGGNGGADDGMAVSEETDYLVLLGSEGGIGRVIRSEGLHEMVPFACRVANGIGGLCAVGRFRRLESVRNKFEIA